MAKPSRPSTAPSGRTGSRKAPASEDKEQSARFIETARELEADESGASFDRILDKVILKPPQPH